FTQELDRLAIELSHRQKINSQPDIPWRFQRHPLPIKQVKHFLKVGVAVGLTLAFIDFAQLPFGYYAAMTVVIAMQPTLGKSIDAVRQRIICTGIGAIVTVVIVNALGGSPLSVGLGVGLTILICSYFGFNQGYKVGCFLVAISIMVHGTEPNSFIWGRCLTTFLGCVIALMVSLSIWPEAASQKLDFGISQTLAKLGTLYETIVTHYLQGLDSRAATAQLSQDIRKSIQTHLTLQAETKLEPVNDFTASKTQRRLNFLISYERTLFSNILSLQQAAGQGDSAGVSQPLAEELQASTRSTVLAFNDLATAVQSQPPQRQLGTLLLTFDTIEQRLKQLRPTRATLKYGVNERIHFYGFLSAMKEIVENLNQMAGDWPS
ncbi:MAG: FUSC family protein, partial [Microcystaceae cyanobacterium]